MNKDDLKISQAEFDKTKVSRLSDRPNVGHGYGGRAFSAQELKERYDASAVLLREHFNALIDALAGMDENGERIPGVADLIMTGIAAGYSLGDLFSGLGDGSAMQKIKVGIDNYSVKGYMQYLATRLADKLEGSRIEATAKTLPHGEEPTVSAHMDGQGEGKTLHFDFGIPEGKKGESVMESGIGNDSVQQAGARAEADNATALGLSTALTETGHVSGYGSIVAPCSTNNTLDPNSSSVVTDHVMMVQETDEAGNTVFRFYSDEIFDAPRGVLLVFRYWPESEGRYQYAHIVASAPSEDTVCSDGEGNDIYLLGSYIVAEEHTGVDKLYSRCYFAGVLSEDKITAAQAHGIGCIAAEMGAFAAGYLARALGRQALAIGFDVEASAPSSVAIGYCLLALSIQQTVLGRYNIPDADERYALLFGNGKDEEHRSNAMWMDWAGNVGFQGRVHSDVLMPHDEHDLITRYYLERALAANGEVCILRNDELDPNVQLGNATTAWSTPTEYTDDFTAPFTGFGGAYVTDGSDFSSKWMLQVKLPSGIDVSGSQLIGIWLAVESTGTGTLSAALQIELTSTGTADKQEKRFDLKMSDGTLVAGTWRFYVLDLANAAGASPFIGYSGITNGEPDETAINYMRVLGIPVTNGRVLIGKCVAIPRHMSVLTGVRGVFADGITVGDVTLTGAQLERMKALI